MSRFSLEDRRRINDFFLSSPRIQDQLPVALENGSVVETLHGHCSRCGSQLRRRDVRGAVRRSIRGYTVTAFGMCVSCNLLTPLMCDLVVSGSGFIVAPRVWRSWSNGDVVEIDFSGGRD